VDQGGFIHIWVETETIVMKPAPTQLKLPYQGLPTLVLPDQRGSGRVYSYLGETETIVMKPAPTQLKLPYQGLPTLVLPDQRGSGRVYSYLGRNRNDSRKTRPYTIKTSLPRTSHFSAS